MMRLAIVGRPNVGKSTMFNRLVGRRLALVDDRPGVTRDLREGAARLLDLRFDVIDTAGLEEATDDSLAGRMRALTERAIAAADVCLFLIDGRAGVTAADEELAVLLRRAAVPVILGVNKAEGRAGEAALWEAYRLGLGDPLLLSAEHGEGIEDLYRALLPHARAAGTEESATDDSLPVVDEPIGDDDESDAAHGDESFAPTPERPLQIAVVGRPNAGKSTLINRILGDERLLTGPEAGITRDAISVSTAWHGTPMRLWDTAGMRKKARITDRVERLSVADGLRAVRFAEVVVVLVDNAAPFEIQDLRIADLAEREGRAVVIAVNKWDLEPHPQQRLAELRAAFAELLPQLRGAPLVALSARTGRGLNRLHDAVLTAHRIWNRRIGTGPLNRWLADMVQAHPPPAPEGRRLRLRYITQTRTRPPGFVVKCSRPDKLPPDYVRYLTNGLRDDFDLAGTPIRIFLRDQGRDNPYRPGGPREGKAAGRDGGKAPRARPK